MEEGGSQLYKQCQETLDVFKGREGHSEREIKTDLKAEF